MVGKRVSIGTIVEIRDPCKCDFSIIWRNLNYTVSSSWVTRKLRNLQGLKSVQMKKTILRDINGEIKSGEMVGFMGPSGAGKSTLLECIVGKRINGRTGEVLIAGDIIDFKVAFVAQHNHFLTHLTVRETILFASKLQPKVIDENECEVQSKDDYCSKQTDQLIADLRLQICANNRVSNCSGGQLKRLAIAQELVSQPKVLVLDEPTSGLDAASSQLVITFLKNLTQQTPKTTVLATIHQPSVKVLNLFDKLYFIASNGDCIYEKPPSQIVDDLANHGLFCPQQSSPADFLMEIVLNEEFKEMVEKLANSHRRYYEYEFSQPAKSMPISGMKYSPKYNMFSQIRILCVRNILATFRDPLLFAFRLFITVATILYFTNMLGTRVGKKGGCPSSLDGDFDPSQLDVITDELEDEFKTIFNNVGNILFIVLLAMFNPLMTTCVSFPNEMIVFKTQKQNLWYTTETFYLGKIAAEIPFQLFFLLCAHPLFYLLQNQPRETWRFNTTFLALFLQQMISQTMGYIIGSLFMYNIPAAVFLGPVMGVIPPLLLCGLFIKIKSMSLFFAIASYSSHLRFTTEALLIALYGYDRCGTDASNKLIEGKDAFIIWFSAMIGVYGDESGTTAVTFDNVTQVEEMGAPSEQFVEELMDTMTGKFISDQNTVRSAVMNVYDYEDIQLPLAISALFIHLIVLRLIAYLIIRFRAKQ